MEGHERPFRLRLNLSRDTLSELVTQALLLRPNDPASVKVLQEHKLARSSARGGSSVGAAGLAAAGVDRAAGLAAAGVDRAAGQRADARFVSSPTHLAGRREFATGSGKGTRKGAGSF